MATKMQTIASTRRFRSAKATSRSIIEEHPALHDDPVARFEPALDDRLIALLERDLHWPGFEIPWRDLDEHLIFVLLQDQRRRGDDWHRLPRREEADIGEHVGLQPDVRIREGDADLGAPCV